ncbi:MAG: sugar nucleotide-binding protein [Verrucomicrobiota bacterium]
MNTVFVTGGSSKLGNRVIQGLLPEFRILATSHRKPLAFPPGGVEILENGLEQCERFARRIQEAGTILHMAAITHTDDQSRYFSVNHELTRRLLEVCRPTQHFVYVSSQCAHPEGGAYARSKWLAEEAIRSSGVNYTIIRPSEVYGSKGGEGIDALLALARKTHVVVDFRHRGPVGYSPVSLDETVDFIVKATRQSRFPRETYTLCNDRKYTATEIAGALRSLVRPLAVVPVPVKLLMAAVRLHLPVPFKQDQLDRLVVPKTLDNSAAKRDYGFQPRSFLDYLADRAHASK